MYGFRDTFFSNHRLSDLLDQEMKDYLNRFRRDSKIIVLDKSQYQVRELVETEPKRLLSIIQ